MLIEMARSASGRFERFVQKGVQVWKSSRDLAVAEFLCKHPGFTGVKEIVGIILGVVVLGTLLYSLWPVTYSIGTNITALTGTDAGTTTIQAVWPIVAAIAGIALVIGIIMYVLDRAGLV